MSYFMNYCDTLFRDVATGERARATNIYSAVDLEEGEEVTDFDDDGNESVTTTFNHHHHQHHSICFQTSFKSGLSSGSKIKKLGAEFVQEGLDGLVATMFCRNTAGTANEDSTLNEAITLIDYMPQLDPGNELY